MNDDKLRKALHSMVPPAPESSAWADGARRRARRTRATVAAAGLLTVGVAAALVIGNLRPGVVVGVPVAPVSSAPVTSSPSASPSGAASCDLTVTSGDIPAEALMLRLCPTGDQDIQMFAPLDALDAEGAHEVLAVLARRSQLGNKPLCRMDLGPAFLLIAEYSGRAPVVMDLQLYGCGVVGTRTDRRTGSEEVLAAFRTALTAQRSHDPAGTVRPGPLCLPQRAAHRTSVLPVRLADITGGTVCGYADWHTALARAERVLDADSLARIIADLEANSERSTPIPCPAPRYDQPIYALALTTRWGDVLSIASDGCPGSYGYQLADGKGLRWRPSAGVAALLRELGQ